jgi:hypothetical protein
MSLNKQQTEGMSTVNGSSVFDAISQLLANN